MKQRPFSRARQYGPALALALAACAGDPVVKEVTTEVKMPVAVQPITAAQVPHLPGPLGPRPKSLPAAADTLAAKVCEWVAYGLQADPLLRVSAGTPPKAADFYPECEGK